MKAVVALGSNLGNRLATLQSALTALGRTSGVEVLKVSEVYETEPIGPAQPKYANAVCVIETSLSPLKLLKVCQEIETELGRIRTEHWGPRTIDIDLVDIADFRSTTDELTIPHTEATNRSFVLVPMAEVDPQWELAGKSAREWATDCEPLERLGNLSLEEAK